jgi:hypothetical protein
VTAIRSVRAAEGKFVQIANEAAQDRRLSLKARGILLYVLSLPPDRTFSAAWLEAQVPEGRESVRAGLAELERCGYFRRTKKRGERGHWVWDQVISDAPLTEEVSGEDGRDEADQSVRGFPADGNPADGKPSDKNVNTETLKHEDQKMASRRAHSSGASASWTVGRVVQDVREAVALVHGDREADELSDGEALGLFFTYVKEARPRDLVAYVVKILGSAPYLETFTSNVEAACTSCCQWESNCECPAKAAA